MNILERALEMCRLEQAMTETEAAALVERDVTEQFTGEAFARWLAATILGFTPSNVTRSVQEAAGSKVHTISMVDGFEAKNA